MKGLNQEEKDLAALLLVRKMIELIGDDPDRDGLKDTPARVVKSWKELYGGYNQDPMEHAKVFEAQYDQVVVVKDIAYTSMCEHHMLPFYGKCHIAYLPKANGNGESKVLGASKFARIVGVYSRRLQIQEQLTQQIAEAIISASKPRGVAVIVDGIHMCMVARGVQQSQSTMRTSCIRGVFREDMAVRSEVLQLLGV